jgi:hypothetical protein
MAPGKLVADAGLCTSKTAQHGMQLQHSQQADQEVNHVASDKLHLPASVTRVQPGHTDKG